MTIDVQYLKNSAFIAGVLFEEWKSSSSCSEFVSRVNNAEDYEPGSFYKRELPCILHLIHDYKLTPSLIIIDGYVFLDGVQRPGLGKYLYDALSNNTEIVGIAKNSFNGISKDFELTRGKSKKPLYITTTGNLDTAKEGVLSMFGEDRIPILVKRADYLCREAANKSLQHQSLRSLDSF